jgi:alpha-beta hydrolase superfamily lysophospholipase
MSLPTYETQSTWKELQKFLPESIQFDAEHKPVEEWWENHGRTIHLDRWRNPDAKIRVVMHHGVGTNGRQMSLILGISLLKAGFEAVAIDMPNYGMTKVAKGTTVSYDDWVNIGNDFVNFELEHDPRPIVLYGLSAGGMLTYHVAALNKKVKGIIGMTFLDTQIQQVRDESCRNLFMSRVGVPAANLFTPIPLLNAISIPFYLASKMWALANDPAAMKIFMADNTSAGAWTSMKFLSSFMNYKPAIPPEEFTVCPVLLTQPAVDYWTPLRLAEPFLKRVKKVDVKIVMLENAGHYPLEQPGLQQMHDVIISFVQGIEASLET